MAKKRSKRYRPKHVAVPWWHQDDARVDAMKNDFGLQLHEGALALERGDATEANVDLMGALFRVARKLAPKMENDEALHETLAYAEAGARTWLRDKAAGRPENLDHVVHMLNGVSVADQILSACSLFEIHRAVQRAKEDRTGFVIVEDEA